MDDLATLSAFDSAETAARVADRRRPGNRCRGLASALSVHRVGASQRRRTAGAIGPAPSRPHRRGDGRTRAGRVTARARLRVRRNRLRPRRRDLGWRGAARRLQGLSAAGAAEVRSVGRRRRQRAAPVPDGVVTSVGGRTGLGRRSGAGACLSRRRAPNTAAPTRDRARMRADIQHGPAVRRGFSAGGRPAGGGLRGSGGHRAGGHVPRLRLRYNRHTRSTVDNGQTPAIIDPAPGSRGGRQRCPCRRARGRDRRTVPPRGGGPGGRPGRGDYARTATPSRCPAVCSRTRCCCGWSCRRCARRISR